MLFAGGIIFVEGMAEQILFPVFAKILGLYDADFGDDHPGISAITTHLS